MIQNFVSHLLEPMIVFSVLSMLAGVHADLSNYQTFLYAVFLVAGMIIPVLAFRLWLLRTKRVSDWDIKKRSQRILPLIALLLYSGVQLFMVYFIGSDVLTRVFTMYFVWLSGMFFITLFWKISGHVGALTLAVLFVIQWFGAYWLPLLLTIPLLSWSRVATKHHTVGQVVCGAVYSLAIVYLSRGFLP